MLRRKSLFQPRWRAGFLGGGGGGPRFGLGSWMGMNANNFYRPGYGYGSGNQHLYHMQNQPSGYSYPAMNTELTMGYPTAYGSMQATYNSGHPDGLGWSLSPTAYSAKIQQNQVNVYDSPTKLNNFPAIDSYGYSAGPGAGGTKGVLLNNKASLTTTRK